MLVQAGVGLGEGAFRAEVGHRGLERAGIAARLDVRLFTEGPLDGPAPPETQSLFGQCDGVPRWRDGVAR